MRREEKMKVWKRIIALTTAVVLLANAGVQGIATAAENEKKASVSENLKTAQEACEKAEKDFKSAQATANSLGEDADQETKEMAEALLAFLEAELNHATEARCIEEAHEKNAKDLGLTVYIPEEWTKTCSDWVEITDDAAKVYFKVSGKNENWGNYTDTDAKEWSGKADSVPDSTATDSFICFWVVNGNKSESRVYRYYYDKTNPEDFNLIVKENGNHERIITSESGIKDKQSGVYLVKYYYGDPEEAYNYDKINAIAQSVTYRNNNFSIPVKNDMYGKTVFVYVFDRVQNVTVDSVYVEEPYTFETHIPKGWTNTYADWVEASDNVEVYFKTSDEEPDDWGSWNEDDAERWDANVSLKESVKEGSFIKFWVVRNEEAVDEDTKRYFYDKTAPEEFEVKTSQNGLEDYHIYSTDVVSDTLSGVDKAYYSVNMRYYSLEDLEDESKAGPVRLEFDEDKNGYRINCDYLDSMAGLTVYIYIVDKAGNMQASSVFVEKKFITHFNVTDKLIAYDDGWNNSYKDWVDVSKDLTVYYRLRSGEHSNLGIYTDSRAKIWGEPIPETSGYYINFWAVDNTTKQVYEKTGQYHYKLDMTPPSGFGLEIKPDLTDYYRVLCVGTLSDARSGVDRAFYTIGEEYKPENGEQKVVPFFLKDGKTSFDFPCTEEMTGKTVYVYVVDAAGNMSSSSIYVEKAINTDAPALSVEGINEDEWIKFETRQKQWKISTVPGAKVYYKVSTTDLGNNWGKYTDEYEAEDDRVREWTNEDDFVNGELYIHFWAVYPLTQYRGVTEATYKFKYDNTVPVIAEAKAEIIPGVFGENNASLKISGLGIKDNESDIVKEQIYYRIYENDNESAIKREGTVPLDALEEGEDGISFTIDLTEGDKIFSGKAYVTVYDLAGNPATCDFGKGFVFNKDIPYVSVETGDLGIVEAPDSEAKIVQPYSYQTKSGITWKSVYINGDEYIKIKAKDEDLKKIKIKITRLDGIVHSVEFRSREHIWDASYQYEWIRITGRPGEDETDTFYLNIGYFKESLQAGATNRIAIQVIDSSDNCCPVKPICDGTNEEFTLFYDPDGGNEPAIENSEVQKYYGVDAAEHKIDVTLTDDNGLKSYTISVNGEKIGSYDISKGEPDIAEEPAELTAEEVEEGVIAEELTAAETPNDRFIPYTKYIHTIDFANTIYPFIKNEVPVDGRYEIEIVAEDLAGNQNSKTFSFIIDTVAPVIDTASYHYENSLINNLPMGMFGSEEYVISIQVKDPDPEDEVDGVGAAKAVISWNETEFVGSYNEDTDSYVFDPLPIDGKGVLTVTLEDELGNGATYALLSTENEDEDGDHSVGMSFGISSKAPVLFLENTPPTAIIILPEEFTTEEGETDVLAIYEFLFEDEHVERWYPGDIELKVNAQDGESGLMIVRITRDGEVYFEEIGTLDELFIDSVFTGMAEYSYPLTEEGSYNLLAYAIDNALNSNETEPAEEQSTIIHIDKTKPQITEFRFGNDSGDGDAVERTNYGFFFTEDTELRIYVKDPGVSSGLNSVTLYLKDINGETVEITKTAEELIVEEVDPNENKPEEDKPGTETSDKDESDKDNKDDLNDDQNSGDQNGGKDLNDDQDDDDEEEQETERYYMSFVIEKGFKGGVSAVVTDNVGHSSGLINADGSIVENPEIHAETSGITITEKDPSRKTDANGIPLYKDQIVLTVTCVDTFSGIDHIDWSIDKDRTSGTISVDLNGKATSSTADAVIIEDSIEYDQNLITKLQFRIVVKSNANGNTVKIKMTDRAGNTSEKENMYSIDTTAPVITASLGDGAPKNGYYYSSGRTITITINERNFNPSDVVVRMNSMTPTVHWNERGASITTDDTAHVGTFTVTEDGDYYVSISYEDIAGNNGDTFSTPRFVIDKTAPKVSNNFESFGSLDDEEIYYNIAQKDNVKAEITVKEVNFRPEDVHLQVYYQPAGSAHTDKDAEWKTYYYSDKWEESGSDIHKLTIPFTEDGVYKITIAPVDRAGNAADLSNAAGGQYPTKTAIFETDYTAPVIAARNGKDVAADDYKFFEFYDYDRRNDDAPAVAFKDTNIAYIVCNGKKYTPVYENGREIGVITPEEITGRSEETVADTYVPTMVYKLDGFDLDGVYSLKLTAYDKAGNASVLSDNTYVRMVDPTVKVLAYIENSDREKATGWYSFEDENGPISKRPSSFSDLSIVVFSKLSDSTQICLVDKATQEVTDTKVTGSEESLFDKDMYDVGAYRYILPGDYFVKNFTADADTGIYLRIVNNGQSLDLGEMNIDNTTPGVTIPEHFHDWGWFSGSGEHVIEFTDLTETLEISETVAYVDGETIHLANLAGNEDSPFVYYEQEKKLTLTLSPGSHKVGLLLVDRAGNTKSIKEVQHLAIGDYRVWIGIGAGFGAILLAVLGVILVKMLKKKKQTA